MTQNIQDLITKIKTEGVAASQKEAQRIEAQARQTAEAAVAEAKARAEQILAQAKEEQAKLEAATRATLKQAARDTVLSLREEISRLLNRVVALQVKESLKPEQMTGLLTEAVRAYVAQNPGAADIRVSLPEKDAKPFFDGAVKKLQDELKVSITLEAADHLSSGFLISFDSGKSSFDFSDESLTAYMSAFVNTEIAKLLKESRSA